MLHACALCDEDFVSMGIHLPSACYSAPKPKPALGCGSARSCS
jgi:hypothetical protein